MKKRYIALGALAAACVAFYYYVPSFENIVKKVVHKYGSEITGTNVNLNGFKLSLANGEGKIQKLTVGNPSGYKTPNLFELDEITVKVNIKSLTKDTIVIDSVEINKPIITYEMLSLTQNNIKEIQNNIKKNTASAPTEKAKTAKEETKKEVKSDAKAGKNVVIKRFVLKGATLNAITYIQGKEAKTTVAMPEIVITGIGEAKNGEDIAVVISKIFTQILNSASKAVVDNQLADLKGIANENLNNVVGGVKDRVKTLGIFKK